MAAEAAGHGPITIRCGNCSVVLYDHLVDYEIDVGSQPHLENEVYTNVEPREDAIHDVSDTFEFEAMVSKSKRKSEMNSKRDDGEETASRTKSSPIGHSRSEKLSPDKTKHSASTMTPVSEAIGSAPLHGRSKSGNIPSTAGLKTINSSVVKVSTSPTVSEVSADEAGLKRHEAPRKRTLGSKKGIAGESAKPRMIKKFTVKQLSSNDLVHSIVKQLSLTDSDLTKLKSVFDSVDVTKMNNIDKEEMCELLDEKDSVFTKQLFALSTSEEIDFDAFIQIVCGYCLYTKEDILQFAFEAFDIDKDGQINEEEFHSLALTIQEAQPLFPGSFAKAAQEFDKNSDGALNFAEFKAINTKFPMLLFPAFRLQDSLQVHTLGRSRWAYALRMREEDKRIRMYMDTHGGEVPPEPLGHRIMRTVLCLPNPYAKYLER